MNYPLLTVAIASAACFALWPNDVPDVDGRPLKPYILVTSHRWGAIPNDGLDDTDDGSTHEQHYRD